MTMPVNFVVHPSLMVESVAVGCTNLVCGLLCLMVCVCVCVFALTYVMSTACRSVGSHIEAVVELLAV